MIEDVCKGFPYKPEIGCFGMASSLLVHDDYNILFDTGNYGARKRIIELLKDNKIDKVVISHLHFDHCSNLDLFVDKDIPVYISKKEYNEYFINKDKDYDLFSYFFLIYQKLNIKLIEKPCEISKNSKLIFTKGHTRGHMSLVVNDSIILAADAIKTFNDYQNKKNYGNAISKTDYLNTKKMITDKYHTIYCGHDGIIMDDKLIDRGNIYEF